MTTGTAVGPAAGDAVFLDDLVTFARLEQAGGDIEPWAAVITALHHDLGLLDAEGAAWLSALYNTYDDLGSAWRIFELWPDPRQPAPAAVRAVAPRLPISQERRNLFGGRVLKRFDSYVSYLDGRPQLTWLRQGIVNPHDPYANFLPLMGLLRRIWGVGRLAAFEWAEFLHKVNGVPVDAPNAHLWEASGPRESIERLYGPPPGQVTVTWLNDMSERCCAMLADAGVALSWWDFETVICDFNVMRKGRYYPGQHIAMIRHEIEGLDGATGGAARAKLRAALAAAVPAPWCEIPPGTDRALRPVYRDTGRIPLPACVTASPARTGGPP